jgi:hypothetical protein
LHRSCSSKRRGKIAALNAKTMERAVIRQRAAKIKRIGQIRQIVRAKFDRLFSEWAKADRGPRLRRQRQMF